MSKENNSLGLSLYPKDNLVEKPQYFDKVELPLSLYPKEGEIKKPQYFNKTEAYVELDK